MILVDTSIWIDHLHQPDEQLQTELRNDGVGTHDLVLQELALGSMRNRNAVLGLLGNLRRFPTLAHSEVSTLVESHRLWGRGLSAVDVHLLGSTMIADRAVLWTRDKRLTAACLEVGVTHRTA